MSLSFIFVGKIQRIAEKRSLYKVYCIGAAFTVRITKIAQQWRPSTKTTWWYTRNVPEKLYKRLCFTVVIFKIRLCTADIWLLAAPFFNWLVFFCFYLLDNLRCFFFSFLAPAVVIDLPLSLFFLFIFLPNR